MAKKKRKDKEYPSYPSKFKNSAKRPSAVGRVITLDTEAVGLLPAMRHSDPTSQHVIVCEDKETQEVFVFFDPYEKRDPKNREWLDEWEGEQDGFLMDGVKFLNECDVLICHNWVGYDGHAMHKVYPGAVTISHKQRPSKKRRKRYPFRVMDTLVMSQLLNPERRPPKEAYAMGKGNIGPHSIEAHGIRIGRYKPENEDWSKLTDHMVTRCWEDTAIGSDFYEFLWDEWVEQSAPNPATGLTIEDAYRMEAVIYWEMAAQEERGFRLDMLHAWNCCKKFDKHIEKIVKKALPHIPKRIKKAKLDHRAMKTAAMKHKVRPKFRVSEDITHGSSRATNWAWKTLSGNYSATTKKDYPEAIGSPYDYASPLVAGPYTPIVWEEVSLGNRDVVRQVLYKEGWRGVTPTDGEEAYLEEHGELPYPYAGKLDQESMDAWAKRGKIPKWARGLLEYYIVTHRRGQILNKKDMDYFEKNGEWPKQLNGKRECRGLVPRARDTDSGKEFQELIEQFGLEFWNDKQWDKDGDYRVPAAAFAIGTNTFRMRHKYVVNIPSRGLYGKEMRQLFIASKGWKILGCDGAGLELRMLAHFMNSDEYTDIVLNGDIHTHNQTKAGLPERDMAKTFIYAFLYGSGIMNLAMVCGVSKKKMAKVVDKFLEEMPDLKDLLEGVQAAARKKGYMKAVDGRWGRVRKSGGKVKEHTALNVLLQMTGSLCMKWGLYIALELFEKAGIPARLVANVHDEVQMEVKADECDEVVYSVDPKDWKAEEKKVMHHPNGDYYSAPRIIGETKKGKLKVRRTYHKAGHLLMQAFEEAGKYLNIRIPLAGEYMVGDSWADTH